MLNKLARRAHRNKHKMIKYTRHSTHAPRERDTKHKSGKRIKVEKPIIGNPYIDHFHVHTKNLKTNEKANKRF